MPSPFPGMDPYIEMPGGWLDFHNTLIAYLRDDLNERLPETYVARTGERVVVETSDDHRRGILPDVLLVSRPGGKEQASAAVVERPEPIRVKAATAEFREAWLEIRDVRGGKVVTVVEMLSPSNKQKGEHGRKLYMKKQREVLASDASLVEIDLLRAGSWTLAVPESVAREGRRFDYLVSVSRPEDRTEFDIYPIGLRNRLPSIAIPLAQGDGDTVADLRLLVDRCYDRGRYAKTIDYRADPIPPLVGKDAAWADGLLRGAGIRR